MTKKEEFKEFIKNKPELVDYIKNGEMTWQKFYEIYDIYGDNPEAWKDYQGIRSITPNLKDLTNMVKNIDMESIKKHINTAQKALGIVQELTTKNSSNISSIAKGPLSPRPLNKFFED